MACWRSSPFLALALATQATPTLYSLGFGREGGPLRFSGYAKNLYLYGHSPTSRQPYGEDLTRLRLKLQGSYGILRSEVEYDQEVRAGTYFQTPEFGSFGLGEPPAAWDLEQDLDRGTHHLWRHRVYRGWAGLETGRWALRFGRQRIAWGTGKLWNPTDVLNPYQPTTVEREERRGVDAVYSRISLGALSEFSAAHSMEEVWKDRSFLGRIKSHLAQADISLMGGKIPGTNESWMAGGDVALDLWGGSLHAEVSRSSPDLSPSFLRHLVGYEYTFSASPPLALLKDAWVLLEYYHNAAGASDPLLYNPAVLFSGREVSLARDYLGLSFSRDLHPLVKLEVVSILNLNDESLFAGPTLTWNALQDLHLLAGWQAFAGKSSSEFGRLKSILHVQAQYFF